MGRARIRRGGHGHDPSDDFGRDDLGRDDLGRDDLGRDDLGCYGLDRNGPTPRAALRGAQGIGEAEDQRLQVLRVVIVQRQLRPDIPSEVRDLASHVAEQSVRRTGSGSGLEGPGVDRRTD